jgi:hypothetical protein
MIRYKFAINYNISGENFTYTSCQFFEDSEQAVTHFRKQIFLYADIQYVLKVKLK